MNRCYNTTQTLIICDYIKNDGIDEFISLWNELQLLELNADKREIIESYLKVSSCKFKAFIQFLNQFFVRVRRHTKSRNY